MMWHNDNDNDDGNHHNRLYAGTALLAVRAPDLSKDKFIPIEVGVVGIYSSYREARDAKHKLQNKWEFRNHELMIASAPLIRSEKDIMYPVGFEIASSR